MRKLITTLILVWIRFYSYPFIALTMFLISFVMILSLAHTLFWEERGGLIGYEIDRRSKVICMALGGLIVVAEPCNIYPVY